MIRLRKRIRTLILLAVSLMLTACSGLFAPAPETPTLLLPSPTETPITVWFPPTSTQTTFPTPVIQLTQVERPGLGAALLSDTFDQPNFWTTASDENARAVIERNQLTLSVNPGFEKLSLRSEPLLADFYAEVTAIPRLCRGSDQYGLVFRLGSAGDYYRYAVNCNGQVRLQRVHSGEAIPVQDWLLSGEAPPGSPGEVKLGVWAVGTEMRVFLNNHYQFTARDPVFQSGALGLFVLSGGATQETVSFSDLAVYAVSYVIPTPTLTPSQTPTPTRTP